MPTSIPPSTLEKFTTFGDLLRFLRRRAGITQMELSIAVGYSDAQICRLEQNLRLPDPPTIESRFVPALLLEDEPQAVARLMELAATVRREDAPEPGMCPYKGLEFFDEADAGLFVGREALSAKLAERVLSLASKREMGENKFLAIVGASGSGKSSLVRAGLVPALRWNKSSANWQIYVFTPTAHPLESLAVTLSQENGSVTPITSMMDDLRHDSRSLSLYVRRYLNASGAPYLLLVIDQFEELFTLCHFDEERSAFIDNLLAASSEEGSQLIIAITLRADFYAHCASYLRLREALATHQEYIGVMSDDEMRRAIEEPARRGRWELEPGLADLVLHDVGHEPGALPLLSHALLETWQRRHGRTLSFSGYTSAGGVRGAIAETAETVFTDQFTHAQQAIARRIFLRLTELGDETATGDTRRRASITELILKPEETDATKAVLKALADARLVTTSEDSVEVAHEALIREWPTLRAWLEDNREGLRLQRQLTEAAQEWVAAGYEPDLLFRGVRLAQAGEWANTHAEDLNIQESEFLAASVESAERDIAEREATRLRELEAARKLAEAERSRAEQESISKNKLRIRAVYLGVALGMTFILVILAVLFARQATQNAALAVIKQSTADAASTQAINEAYAHSTAEAKALLQRSTANAASLQAINESNIRATAEAQARAEAAINLSLRLAGSAQSANQAGQPDTALALALEAAKIDDPPPDVIAALRSIASSPGTRLILDGHSSAIHSIAINPDGHTAFSGSCANIDAQGSCKAGKLILWDLEARKELLSWAAHAGWVEAVVFSPDGQVAVSGGADGQIILWDAHTGAEIRRLAGHPPGIVGLAITPTGALFAGSQDGTVIEWDLQSGSILQRFESPPVALTTLAVAANSPIAATGYQDGSLIIWDLSSGKKLRSMEGSGDPVGGIAISPDGSYLITTMVLTISKIDIQSGSVTDQYSTGGTPGLVIISPDGKSALVLLGGGILQVSTTDMHQILWLMPGAELEDYVACNLSQDGRMLITGHTNGTLRLWNLVEALDYKTSLTGLTFSDSLSISQDGQYLLLGDAIPGAHSPLLWEISTAKVTKNFQEDTIVTAPQSVVLSPDGQYAAAGGGNINTNVPQASIWSLKSREVLCHLESEYRSPVRSLAFSPDSQYLLVGSQSTQEELANSKNDLILWDVQTCQLVRRFAMDQEIDVTDIAFSSNGRLAATGTAYYKYITLWDVDTGQEVRRFTLPVNSGFLPIFDLAFGANDQTIFAPGLGTIYQWDVNSGAILRQFTGATDMIWSLDVSPDGKYLLSGANNGEVILWDIGTGEELYLLPAHSMPVLGVTFSPDGEFAYSISTDGLLAQWRVPSEQTLPELLDWINANRYVRPLTCEERQRYRVEPLCEQKSP